MKRSRGLLFFLLLTTFSIGQKKDTIGGDNGQTLLRACSLTLDANVYHPRKLKNKFEGFDLGFCLGVFKGVYTSSSGRDFCAEQGIPIREGLKLTVKFIKDHPDLQEKDAADIVRWALSDEFPCQRKQEGDTTEHNGTP
jgi:hypothetical protein